MATETKSLPSLATLSTPLVTRQWLVDESGEPKVLDKQVAEAAALLKANEVVGFPTETVYGLAGNAFSDEAISKIYQAKGRPSDNPLIVHVATLEQCRPLTQPWPLVAQRLAAAFWPGPLTIILKKDGPISSKVTAGHDTVALRMPSHPIALALIRTSGLPIAAPSANLSGKPSPTTAQHVMADLNGRIAGCVDGGPTGVGVESTVVDCSRYAAHIDGAPTPPNGAVLTDRDEPLVILRPGGVTKADLERVVGVGRVVTDLGIWAAKPAIPPSSVASSSTSSSSSSEQSQTVAPAASSSSAGDAVAANGHHGPRAPGMKYTHYAPRAPVWIVDGSNEYFQQQIDASRARGERVGVLATEERARELHGDVVIPCGLITDLNTVARKLYDCLRAFDDTDVAVIYSEQFAPPDDKGMGEAVMNRLDKAAGHRLLRETPLPSSVSSAPSPASSS